MFQAPDSPYRVPFDGSFNLQEMPTNAPDGLTKKKALKKELKLWVKKLDELQRVFYANDRHSLLLIFQAMDAAGKDGTIRAVMSGINPAGCQVHSFKKPSTLELDHDFLWRSSVRLPERGRIGIFNRSYYEETLVVRVHPKILDYQQLPDTVDRSQIWQQRYESILDHEKHLARNGTVILKFWLNVSREKQRQRFLARLDEPEKNWKFSSGDVRERGHWDDYMKAYQETLSATSKPWAPWYAIPADNKPYMRARVAELIVQSLEGMALQHPEASADQRAEFAEMRALLESE